MIVFTRTACIARGMMMPAQAFGREIVKFIKEKDGVDVELLLPWGGNFVAGSLHDEIWRTI